MVFKSSKISKKNISWDIIPIAQNNTPGGSHYFDFGDINGDGRPDLALGAKGKPFDNGNYFAVFYAPEDTQKPWRKELLPNAGNQIGATHAAPADVNGDGKVDILASLGHGTGVVWFEALIGLNMLLMLICCILIPRILATLMVMVILISLQLALVPKLQPGMKITGQVNLNVEF